VRLVRVLGTAHFCPGIYVAVLGWSADGTVLYLTNPRTPTFVVRGKDARSGAVISERQLGASPVTSAVPAGVAHTLAVLSDGGLERCLLWNLDEGARVG
jgi:hypothetical protein